ncbi:MAG: LPS export ABC transporter periplasmic protein LptC [Bacteroidota bacterium]
MRDDLPTSNNSTKHLNAVQGVSLNRFLGLILLTFFISCSQRKELVDLPLYEGPTSSLDSIYTVLSDSGQFVMSIKSPKQNDFEIGDTEWPDGVYVEYFNDNGRVTTYFKANYVYYTKAEKLYHAVGNVVVRNLDNGDELTTEELYWDEGEERYYTEKFVTIKTDGEVHTGEGLDANQDFTEYRILKPSGTFTLEDDPTNPAPRDVPLRKLDEVN